MHSRSPFIFVNALAAAVALLSTPLLARADSVADLLKKGDTCDVKLEAADALDAYLKADKLKPNDADILVRIARQYRHLMSDAATPAEKLRLGNIALTYGERAAALAPKDSDAQLSPAISCGKMAPYEGKKEQVAFSVRIRKCAEAAVRLNPKNDLAWHVLGRWHRTVCEVSAAKRAMASILYQKIPDASISDSVTCLQKAIAINPGRTMHYVELGLTLAQMGNTAEARRILEKSLTMPDQDKDDPDRKAQARATLAALH